MRPAASRLLRMWMEGVITVARGSSNPHDKHSAAKRLESCPGAPRLVNQFVKVSLRRLVKGYQP